MVVFASYLHYQFFPSKTHQLDTRVCGNVKLFIVKFCWAFVLDTQTFILARKNFNIKTSVSCSDEVLSLQDESLTKFNLKQHDVTANSCHAKF